MHDHPDVHLLNHRTHEMASAIVELQHASYAIEAALIGSDAIPPLHESVEMVAGLDLTFLAIVQEEVPVAIVGYRRDGEIVDIDRLAVHPAWFRRGFARRLMHEVHQRACDAGEFTVSTGRDNRPAVALYRKLGYQPVGDVVLPEGLVITRLRRSLDARK